jgi:hypothetical protein
MPDTPTITDWISAGAAVIGVPLAVWSFIKLVLRDKDRETEIRALTETVLSLEKQTQELSKQTRLLSDDFNLKENLAKASHKPEFKLDHEQSHLDGTGFRVTLINAGQKAMLVKLANERDFGDYDWSIKITYENSILETAQEFYVDAKYIPFHTRRNKAKNQEELNIIEFGPPIPKEKFSFDLIFKDALGNCYKQQVIGNENPGYYYGLFKLEEPETYFL